MDSDDDFGDFTSVPAGAFHVADPSPFESKINAAELDVGTSFRTFGFYTSSTDPKTSFAPEAQFGHLSAVEGQDSFPIKPMESNSDDDWGDFVEHSAPADCDNSQVFDWLGTTQHSAQQGLPSLPFTKGNADTSLLISNDWKDGFLTGVSKLEAQPEQKAGAFVYNDVDFLGLMGNSNLEGNKVSTSEVLGAVTSRHIEDEMAAQQVSLPFEGTVSGQRVETHGSSTSNGISSSPIPLSLFGDSELETEDSKTELSDVFQGYTRNTACSTSSFGSGRNDLSNFIANLYTEAQPLPGAKDDLHMDTVAPNKIENSMNKLGEEEDLKNSFSGYQSSTVGGSWKLEQSIFGLTLGLEHASGTGSSKGDICSTARAELQSEEASSSSWLDSISMSDQCAFVEAWASILAVCASELELALDVWKQAQLADVHLALLANLQGKKYFAAIGQVYVVSLILGATSNFYKRWLHVATKKGESLRSDLERCRAVWMETNLREGVCLALNGLEDPIPISVVSWNCIEGFAMAALEAYKQAPKASVHSICKISLLPMASFSCLCSVEWCGASYLLPVANLWINCVSQKPPATCLST